MWQTHDNNYTQYSEKISLMPVIDYCSSVEIFQNCVAFSCMNTA